MNPFEMIPLSIAGVLTGVAAFLDYRSREIPDWIPLGLLLGAGLLAFCGTELPWWSRLGGMAIALGATIPLAWNGGIGGGDVKLMAGLGALMGIVSIFWILCGTAIIGMMIAILTKLRGGKDFAYGPAIFLGTIGHGVQLWFHR